MATSFQVARLTRLRLAHQIRNLVVLLGATSTTPPATSTATMDPTGVRMEEDYDALNRLLARRNSAGELET